ncbi:MAG: cobyrinate a,c-diamide synthase [Candidatus Latescibacterota bacterium]|nr:MAG: cobyrinate a,c-diamide synthase [Candidatus Latescibacterota bacterium]
MATGFSRLVIAGLSGDSGKTIASLSFLRALRRRGLSVSVFKKGPDYIDPAWLSAAAETDCRNLDTYMVEPDVVRRTFVVHAEKSDIAVIEGNRGLFDGRDVSGTHSTAELAKLTGTPVVLVVNAAKVTRTVAAVVKGCLVFDPDVTISGVILNRVAGRRHFRVLEGSIKDFTGLPVLGAIPNLGDDSTLIPGRHLGLVTPAEYKYDTDLWDRLLEIGEDHLDIGAMIEIARSAKPISCEVLAAVASAPANVKIGYFRDSVFTFYYPENLEALEARGAELVPVSSVEDNGLPEIDALYIGGGFPETHADELAGNRSMMESVKHAAVSGLPIYAECGGLIYLARSLRCNEKTYPMSGLFPIDLGMHPKPVGHGYTEVRVDEPNPFYPVGTAIRGHEFHYSGPIGDLQEVKSCMAVETGVGVGNTRDGLVAGNTLACYTHIHADGVKDWADSMISSAAKHAAKHTRKAAGNSGASGGFKSMAI